MVSDPANRGPQPRYTDLPSLTSQPPRRRRPIPPRVPKRKMLHEKAYPPTVREIGLAIGLSSSSTVQNHLNTLERKGYIRRDPAKSRAA